MAGDRIKIGGLKGPHGLQGWVKAKLFLADNSLVMGQTLQQEDGTPYTVQNLKAVGQGLVALHLAGVTMPEQAAALKGPLYLPKAALPLDEDDVLLADLVGQPLLGHTGTPCATIVGIAKLPAGPALEVTTLAEKPKKALVPVEAAFVSLSAATPPAAQLTELGAQLLTL